MARKKRQNKTFLIVLLLLLLALVAAFVIKQHYPKIFDKIEKTYNVFDVKDNKNATPYPSNINITSDNDSDSAISSAGDIASQDTASSPRHDNTPPKKNNNKNKARDWVAKRDNDPLLFGNPTNAANVDKSNYLLVKNTYTMSYNDMRCIPNWVAWHLDLSDIGTTGRSGKFISDSSLPPSFTKITSSDYNSKLYGFDRGHLCPSADRSRNINDNRETFLMTNMVPQSPRCNRILWKALEDYERTLTKQGKELYIVAGTYGVGAKSQKGYFEYIKTKGGKSITVPKYCYKIILILEAGDNDFMRATKNTAVIGVFIDNNEDSPKNYSWKNYVVSVDYIEEKTAADFFAPLDDDIEDAIEKKQYYIQLEEDV